MRPKTKYGLVVLTGLIGFSVIACTLLIGSTEEKEYEYVRAFDASMMGIQSNWLELKDQDNNTLYYPVDYIGVCVDIDALEKGSHVIVSTKFDIYNQAGKVIKIRVER